MNPGDKINFPKGNQIRFEMDFHSWQGIPDDVDFFFEGQLAGGKYVELWADGYGGGIHGRPGSYGNGSIFVRKGDLPSGVKSKQ